MITVGIITASDKGYEGERVDVSGRIINEFVAKKGYCIKEQIIIPDDFEQIRSALIKMSDALKVDLILTTGGTGFSKRDITPEATISVVERAVPGIPEAIRNYSLKITARAMLSRAVAGIRGDTLIINLPGSPKAVTEILEYIMDSVEHGVEILKGTTGECAESRDEK